MGLNFNRRAYFSPISSRRWKLLRMRTSATVFLGCTGPSILRAWIWIVCGMRMVLCGDADPWPRTLYRLGKPLAMQTRCPGFHSPPETVPCSTSRVRPAKTACPGDNVALSPATATQAKCPVDHPGGQNRFCFELCRLARTRAQHPMHAHLSLRQAANTACKHQSEHGRVLKKKSIFCFIQGFVMN